MRALRPLGSSEGSKQGAASSQESDSSGRHEDQDERDEALFDSLIEAFETELGGQAGENREELARQYAKFTESYRKAMAQAQLINDPENPSELQIRRDAFPYKPTTLDQYGLEFISQVDPFYVADI